MTANIPKSSKVFISYSRESSQHDKRVLELANRLCNKEIDCNLDQYVTVPKDGWIRWMINQIEEANFVLIVCTEEYKKKFMAKAEAGKGLGDKWEGDIILEELYYSAEAKNKFIPIVFSPGDSKYIPPGLKSVPRYDLSSTEDYDKLCNRLTGQELVSKPPIGKSRPLESKYSSSVSTVQDRKVKLAENKQKSAIGSLKTIGEEDKPIKAPKVFTSPSTGMEFVLIPAGRFTMGSPSNEQGEYAEGPVHKVTIKEPFYLGKYPVTQKQWIAVMGNNPSYFKGDNLPVERVSWIDVQDFIVKMNEIERTDKYRLPSEAEWEYACRAGTQTRYSFGDDESKVNEYAWYNKNSGSKTHPVGQKKPNRWSLYDMHGNVWEYVQDSWHYDYKGAPSDGGAWEDVGGTRRVSRLIYRGNEVGGGLSANRNLPNNPFRTNFSRFNLEGGSSMNLIWEDRIGSYRIKRGGSWGSIAGKSQSANREYLGPEDRSSMQGFRLLREL